MSARSQATRFTNRAQQGGELKKHLRERLCQTWNCAETRQMHLHARHRTQFYRYEFRVWDVEEITRSFHQHTLASMETRGYVVGQTRRIPLVCQFSWHSKQFPCKDRETTTRKRSQKEATNRRLHVWRYLSRQGSYTRNGTPTTTSP